MRFRKYMLYTLTGIIGFCFLGINTYAAPDEPVVVEEAVENVGTTVNGKITSNNGNTEVTEVETVSSDIIKTEEQPKAETKPETKTETKTETEPETKLGVLNILELGRETKNAEEKSKAEGSNDTEGTTKATKEVAKEESKEVTEEAKEETKQEAKVESKEDAATKEETKAEENQTATAEPEKEANEEYTKADLRLLSSLVYCESGGQPYQGKLAVAMVVMNRKRSSKYSDTVKGVVYQAGQFGPAHNGALEKALNAYDAGQFTSAAKKECINAAAAALSGVKTLTIDGKKINFENYLYFNTSLSGYTLQIGSHQFK